MSLAQGSECQRPLIMQGLTHLSVISTDFITIHIAYVLLIKQENKVIKKDFKQSQHVREVQESLYC